MRYIDEWKEDPEHESLDDFDNDIVNHYLIHEAFTYDGTARYYTFESLGIFNCCREIVDYVISDLEKYIEEKNVIIDSNDIKDLNNKYFKKLNIVFKEDKSNTIHGEYLTGYLDDSNDALENSRWDKENNIFNFINIVLYNCDILYINEVAEILTHELIHSWDDYILHSKSFSSLRNKTIDYDEYKKSFDELKRNLYKNDNTIKNINFIDRLLYYLNKFEMNAYIGQLSTELGNNKYDDIKDVVKAIQNNSIYKTYKLIYTVAFIDDGKWLVDNGATKSQVNKIKKLVKQAYNKIINHSYLACEDHLKKNINKGSSTLSFDKALSYIWKRK